MSIKIALLKSGESVIGDIKELLSDDQVCGYLFKKPYTIEYAPTQMYLSEETESSNSGEVDINFSPWIAFTKDTEIPVRYDWLVTIVSPVDEIEKLYKEMIDGQNNQSDSTDEQ
tara:strand:+ start:336 stop:677 length:342 start_codon:yes stop_codon:yes gene_type:complete